MAVEAPPPAPPPPVVFDEPSEMAIQQAPPAPPAPKANTQTAEPTLDEVRKTVSPREDDADSKLERQQLGKLKGDDMDRPAVTGGRAASNVASNTGGAGELAETSTKRPDAVANAIAELPRRFRRAVDQNAKLYPETWLARIDALLANDQREEAVANLRVFRIAYPKHVLPEALATLAREEGIGGTDPQP